MKIFGIVVITLLHIATEKYLFPDARPLFGCRYWVLDVSKVYASGSNAWDTAVHDASEEYKHRMVNKCSCDLFTLLYKSENPRNDLCSLFFLKSTTSAVTTVTRMSPWL